MKKELTKQGGKTTIQEIVQRLDKLVVEGISITRQAQEGDAIYCSPKPLHLNSWRDTSWHNKFLHDVHKKYLVWKDDIKKVLDQELVLEKIDIGIFNEADSIPKSFGGLEYGDLESEESQTMLKNIRTETSKKLEHLRKMSELLNKKQGDENRFPYKLPAGTKWENIAIKFLGDENVFIKAGQYKHETNYREMGLAGKGKTPRPGVLWTFLKALAIENGEIVASGPGAKPDPKYKKQKELLSKAIISYFEIDLDPFYPYDPYPPYKTERSYKIRLLLIPLPEWSKNKPVESNKKKPFEEEIREFYKEQAPEI